VHSALISRLISISPRKPLLFSLDRISVALDEDGTSSFISSLHLRPTVPLRISWTAIEPRSPLGLRTRSLSTDLPSAAFSVFLSPRLSPRYPGFLSIAVIRLRLRRRLFSPRHLARSSAVPLFLLSHSRFRSVGLWGRKNERTSERTVGQTQLARRSSLFPIVLSLSVGRRSFVRSLYSLAQSLGHPPSPSLFAGSVYLLIATSPRLPRADRGLRQFPLSRSSFPSSLPHSAAAAALSSFSILSLSATP